MPTCINPTGFVIVVVTLALIASTLLAIALKIAKIRREDLHWATFCQDAADRKIDRAITSLETIRDMGPTGPDPLPSCRFCGQGPGHWTTPIDPTCPSVFAWKTLRALQ